MKRLVFDKLRRGWILWFFYSLLFLVIGFVLSSVVQYFSSGKESWLILYWLALLFNINLELKDGYGRVALSLPFTARQVGRVLWIISVALPTALLVVCSALGILISGCFHGPQPGIFLPWIEMVTAVGLTCGTLFWLFSGVSMHRSEKLEYRLVDRAKSLLVFAAVAGGGYFLYKSNWNGSVKGAVTFVLGAIFSVMGWLRAEQMVVKSGGNRANAFSKSGRGRFRPRQGFGGIGFLISRSLFRVTAVAALIVTFMSTACLFEHHQWTLSFVAQYMPMAQLFLSFFVMAEVVGVLLHLRLLRSLPLKPVYLAGAIQSLVIFGFLIGAGVTAGIVCLDQGASVGLSLFKAYVLGIAPLSIIVVAGVWQGESRLGRIVLMAVAFFALAALPIYQLSTGIWNSGKADVSITIIISYPVIVLAIATLLTAQLLQTNGMTYRIMPRDLKGFSQFG